MHIKHKPLVFSVNGSPDSTIKKKIYWKEKDVGVFTRLSQSQASRIAFPENKQRNKPTPKDIISHTL